MHERVPEATCRWNTHSSWKHTWLVCSAAARRLEITADRNMH